MTEPSGPAARLDWRERAFNPDAIGLRQLPFTVSFGVAVVYAFVIGDTGAFGQLLLSILLVLVVQLAGFLLPWRRFPTTLQAVLPLGHMAALALFEIGTGSVLQYAVVLCFLPVVNLASQEGWLGASLGTIAAAVVVQFTNASTGVTDPRQLLGRSVGLPLVAFFVGLYIDGVIDRLRARNHSLLLLQRQEEFTHERLQRSHSELEAAVARLSSTRDSLQDLIDAATLHAIIGVDFEGRVTEFNRGAQAMLGFPRELARGMPVATLFDEEELRSRVEARGLPWTSAGRRAVVAESALEEGAGVGEWTFRRRDGEAVPVQVAVSRRPPAEDGSPAGFLFVATDITDRRHAERLQDEFIGLVSHELRTPLNSILGYLDLLRTGPDALTSSQSADLEVIDRNARRLLRLVNDLLLSVQLSAGRFALSVEDVDIVALLNESVHALRPSAAAAGITLEVVSTEALTLRADPVRVAQLLENLIGNAVKFTPRGGAVTVTGSATTTETGAHAARIVVSDTGIGLAPDEIDRLTERFYRAGSAQTRRVRGVGLGLPIVQAIVDAHGGTLAIESALGSGTTVTVSLPDAPDAPEGSDAAGVQAG